MIKIGIDALSFHIPQRYLHMDSMAERHGIDPAKFSKGIGQEKIALTGPDEDIVTLAAEAAKPILEAEGVEGIDTMLFATESGIDQSKSAGVFAHRLLGLPDNCRNVEMKHACYSATAALQLACGYIARHPAKKVLIVASDVSRYDLDSSGEATQGAGAVAMLITANPRIMEIDAASGIFTEDIMDFWRPNYRQTPLVDGKYSALRYLNSLSESWADYQAQGGRAYDAFAGFCYHLPFSRMAEKGHRHLAKQVGVRPDMQHCLPGMIYNRQIGNCYAASLYLALISALENTEADLAGKAIGMFSYGSGAVGEFFSGVVQPGYQDQLMSARHAKLLADRQEVSYDEYLALREIPDGQPGGVIDIPASTNGRYRLASINEHKRVYIDTQD